MTTLDRCVRHIAYGALALLVTTALASDAERDRLRTIVQQQCLPHWMEANSAAPCVSLHLFSDGPNAAGFAVLPDRKGGAHYLLIPTRTISGIESQEVRSPSSPNYFDAAWEAREVLNGAAGRALQRTEIGLAVNAVRSRSQDQLHIHIECLSRLLYEALKAGAARIGNQWSAIQVHGWPYQTMRVMGTGLGTQNPFELLADGVPGARDVMGSYTLLVAGMEFNEGPGFVLLAGVDGPGAEHLLDSTCAV